MSCLWELENSSNNNHQIITNVNETAIPADKTGRSTTLNTQQPGPVTAVRFRSGLQQHRRAVSYLRLQDRRGSSGDPQEEDTDSQDPHCCCCHAEPGCGAAAARRSETHSRGGFRAPLPAWTLPGQRTSAAATTTTTTTGIVIGRSLTNRFKEPAPWSERESRLLIDSRFLSFFPWVKPENRSMIRISTLTQFFLYFVFICCT